MGFFKGLFGKGDEAPDVDLATQAKGVLAGARDTALYDPKAALKTLGKEGKRLYPLFRVGGELHDEYRGVTAEAWAKSEGLVATPATPTVVAIPWDTWPEPMLRDLAARAQDAEEDILYFTPPEKRSHRNAMAELDGLKRLANDDAVVMVVIGEEAMMFRRPFLLEAGRRLPPETEEIGQDLMDFAEERGLKVGMVVA